MAMIKVPTIQRDMINGQLVTKRGELALSIDTSFLAHLKWEEQFQPTLGVDLATYTERVRGWVKDPEHAKPHFIGMLKLLYCYVNSDRLPTFPDFCRLFDIEVADEIMGKITAVLTEVGKSVSKN